MQSSKARWAVGIGSIVLVAVLFVLLSADDDELAPSTQAVDTTAQTTTESTGGEGSGSKPSKPKPKPDPITTIVVEGGEPKGGIADLEYDKGDQVAFKIDSDVDEEVHIHGYDITKDVSAGNQVEFDFDADIDGVYEVELEQSGVQLAQLTVNP